jgi:hypothetical protein
MALSCRGAELGPRKQSLREGESLPSCQEVHSLGRAMIQGSGEKPGAGRSRELGENCGIGRGGRKQ